MLDAHHCKTCHLNRTKFTRVSVTVLFIVVAVALAMLLVVALMMLSAAAVVLLLVEVVFGVSVSVEKAVFLLLRLLLRWGIRKTMTDPKSHQAERGERGERGELFPNPKHDLDRS